MTDEAGEPLRRAIVWLDRCRAEGLPPDRRQVGPRVPGGAASRETVATFMRGGRGERARARRSPRPGRASASYLLLSGFLTHRLTGRVRRLGRPAQVGYLPFDYKRAALGRPGRLEWQALPVQPELAARARAAPARPLGDHHRGRRRGDRHPAGPAADRRRGRQGLRGARLRARSTPHIGAISLGHDGHDQHDPPPLRRGHPARAALPGRVPGAYSLEVQVYRGYWMVEWFKREFGDAEVARARERGRRARGAVRRARRGDPAGLDGPRPAAVLVARRARSPGPRRRAPSSAGATSTRAPTSTGRSSRASPTRCARAPSGRSSAPRCRSASCASSGGGSQSPAAIQLTADIFGLPTSRPHTHETSGLGAAIDAAVGLGLHPSFEAAVASMTRIAETREPDPRPTRCTRSCTAASTCSCTSGCARCTARSAESPAIRPRSERAADRPATGPPIGRVDSSARSP